MVIGRSWVWWTVYGEILRNVIVVDINQCYLLWVHVVRCSDVLVVVSGVWCEVADNGGWFQGRLAGCGRQELRNHPPTSPSVRSVGKSTPTTATWSNTSLMSMRLHSAGSCVKCVASGSRRNSTCKYTS